MRHEIAALVAIIGALPPGKRHLIRVGLLVISSFGEEASKILREVASLIH